MARILTTHVGSLVRPPELVGHLRAIDAGEPHDRSAYSACLRRSVHGVVARQAAAGLDLVSDGEFGKTVSWSRYVRERLAGFSERPAGEAGGTVLPGTDKRRFGEFYAEYEKTQGFTGSLGGWVCTGPVRYVGHDAVRRDIDTLQAALAEVDVRGGFLPVVAPASVVPLRADEYYPDEASYVFAVADALAVEYRTIVDAGLGLQVDDAWLASMYDTMVPARSITEYREWAELRVEALNRALDGIPPDRVRYHVCFGSWNAPHVGDAPLREILDLILRVRAGGYSLEQANPRHEHEWRIWEGVALPADKVLLPGLVSHATNVVEHPELVAQRIVRLARLVGPERVVASTDCGFAQGPFVRRVHPTIQWAKLEALVAGAQLAGKEL